MRSGVVVQQRDTFREQSRSFPANYLVQMVQRGTITGSIQGRSPRMEINQKQALVLPKDCGHNFIRGCFELLMGGDEEYLHDNDASFV
ncbi:hypothetical protein AVEN_14555-1 [Araneus ventricosus]|uniref:Uncharacterized protein n=1 Tax=Araneus ventricosus TaxID=182803 RepID=A0A4Y2CFA6_ARAVE|nr:hypothetical protein AVEN_14555-1 [Araneus ventricosus]